MRVRRASASSAFSRSSFTTDAGRSTTSPAAILLATASERTWILPMRFLGWPGVSLSDDNWEGKESSGKLSDELWAKFRVAPSSDRLDLPQVPARSRAV